MWQTSPERRGVRPSFASTFAFVEFVDTILARRSEKEDATRSDGTNWPLQVSAPQCSTKWLVKVSPTGGQLSELGTSSFPHHSLQNLPPLPCPTNSFSPESEMDNFRNCQPLPFPTISFSPSPPLPFPTNSFSPESEMDNFRNCQPLPFPTISFSPRVHLFLHQPIPSPPSRRWTTFGVVNLFLSPPFPSPPESTSSFTNQFLLRVGDGQLSELSASSFPHHFLLPPSPPLSSSPSRRWTTFGIVNLFLSQPTISFSPKSEMDNFRNCQPLPFPTISFSPRVHLFLVPRVGDGQLSELSTSSFPHHFLLPPSPPLPSPTNSFSPESEMDNFRNCQPLPFPTISFSPQVYLFLPPPVPSPPSRRWTTFAIVNFFLFPPFPSPRESTSSFPNQFLLPRVGDGQLSELSTSSFPHHFLLPESTSSFPNQFLLCPSRR